MKGLAGIINGVAGAVRWLDRLLTGNTLSKSFDIVGKAVNAVLSPFRNFRKTAGDALAWVKGIAKQALDYIRKAPGDFLRAGAALITSLWNGMKRVAGKMLDWAKGVVRKIRNLLPGSEPRDVTSPLYNLRKSGEATIDNYLAGIRSRSGEVDRVMRGIGVKTAGNLNRDRAERLAGMGRWYLDERPGTDLITRRNTGQRISQNRLVEYLMAGTPYQPWGGGERTLGRSSGSSRGSGSADVPAWFLARYRNMRSPRDFGAEGGSRLSARRRQQYIEQDWARRGGGGGGGDEESPRFRAQIRSIQDTFRGAERDLRSNIIRNFVEQHQRRIMRTPAAARLAGLQRQETQYQRSTAIGDLGLQLAEANMMRDALGAQRIRGEIGSQRRQFGIEDAEANLARQRANLEVWQGRAERGLAPSVEARLGQQQRTLARHIALLRAGRVTPEQFRRSAHRFLLRRGVDFDLNNEAMGALDAGAPRRRPRRRVVTQRNRSDGDQIDRLVHIENFNARSDEDLRKLTRMLANEQERRQRARGRRTRGAPAGVPAG